MAKILALASCILMFCFGAVFGQTVEKSSASFTFPTTMVGALFPGKTAAVTSSFFHATAIAADRGSIVLAWSVPQSARKGSIALYNVSGALVKKIDLTQNHGKVFLAPELPAAGVFLATLSFGAYKQTLKLALYR